MSHYEKYLKANCKWCANGPIVWVRVYTKDDGPWHIDELGDKVERCTALRLKEWSEQIAANLEQVDDVLIVNWITAKDNDYRKALAELVTMNIAQHDDPALNPPITGVAIRHRETKAVFSMPKPARHDTLILELVKLGEPDFAKGEQGFVTEDGRFLEREEAFVYALRFGQLKNTKLRRLLFSEDLW